MPVTILASLAARLDQAERFFDHLDAREGEAGGRGDLGARLAGGEELLDLGALSLCARLLGRAQRSEHGAYWSAPNTNALQAQFAPGRLSLAMGSSGPLLALLSQKQTTANSKQSDVLEQGFHWLRYSQKDHVNKTMSGAVRAPGFFLGECGWWWMRQKLTDRKLDYRITQDSGDGVFYYVAAYICSQARLSK